MIRCQFCHHDNPAENLQCAHCGATIPEKRIRFLIEDGNKIEAIKLYRETTGAGLKEAKDAVEAIEQGQPVRLPGRLDEQFEREVTELLQAGRKIEAIMRLRHQTGAGLKQAKDVVDAIERDRHLASAGNLEATFEYKLIELLQAGRKIEAIKLFRERTGADLKQAKDSVERIAAASGIAVTSDPAASGGIGCLNTLLLAAALIVELFLA